MICAAATIVSLLGQMPPPGTVIVIPRSEVAKYSTVKRLAAERCARKYQIRWTIDETR